MKNVFQQKRRYAWKQEESHIKTVLASIMYDVKNIWQWHKAWIVHESEVHTNFVISSVLPSLFPN